MPETARCETRFVGWERPLLVSATEFLWDEFGPSDRLVGSARKPADDLPAVADRDSAPAGIWDLSDWLVVLPTGRSLRRLRQRVRGEAQRRGVELLRHPRWLTIGELAEHLYRVPAGAFQLADETERTLAWTAALRGADDAVLADLFRSPPPRDQLGPWIDLAATLERLHEDLASAGIGFAEVVRQFEQDASAQEERQRWESLSRLHVDYLGCLAAADRTDPSDARRRAVDEGRCGLTSSILLVGTSDLSESVTGMLRHAVAATRSVAAGHAGVGRLVSLIAAGPEQADCFDEFGSVDTERWSAWRLPWTDDHWVAADDVPDQAAAAAECIRRWREQAGPEGGRTEPGEITVGVTDESMVAAVEFELHQGGWDSYRELGWTFALTPVGRLVELLTDHLNQRTWQSLAALVRHADVHDRLDQTLPADFSGSRWLVSLDELLAEHYPTDLSSPLTDAMMSARPGGLGGEPAVAVAAAVAEMLRAFERGEPQRLSLWAAAIGSLFDTIYSEAAAEQPTVPTDEEEASSPAVIEQRSVVGRAERRAQITLHAARRKLASLSELGPALDTPMPAAAALDLIAGRLLGLRVSDAARDEAIQISGWLDLALDESPALIVIGFNHPYVPDSVTADPFLPGSLRSRLGMADNERRLARDIYVTQLILATRPHARFVVGRRGADGSPTPPTRLLAASKPGDVARRLIQLLDSDATNRRRQSAPPMPRLWDHGADRTGLPIPKLVPKEPIRSLSVTSFSAYLACPYRFFLRHELQLKPIDDASRELAANQFGDLIHQSLEWFGNSPEKDETDVVRIEAALLDALDRFAADHLGAAPTPAVRLQVEQARRRLKHVAKAQAERRQAGWSIWKVEASVGPHNQAGIEVDGRRMGIRGRFDRIDRHPSGAWAILDYKTHGFPPRKKHLKKSPSGGYRWIDLQLPIYRMMIPFLVGQEVDPSTVSLGYFNIGDKGSETRINEADFSEAEFAQAEEVIRDCIRRIWDGDFAPSQEPVAFDDYAMILQMGILQSEVVDDWLATEES